MNKNDNLEQKNNLANVNLNSVPIANEKPANESTPASEATSTGPLSKPNITLKGSAPEQTNPTPPVAPSAPQPSATITEAKVPETGKTEPKKKNSTTIIIAVIALIALIAVIACVKFFNGGVGTGGNSLLDSGTKNGTALNIGQVLQIRNNYTNADIVVEAVERNAQASNYIGEHNFTKIKMTVKNNNDENLNFLLTSFTTLDAEGLKTSEINCYDKFWGELEYSEVTDFIDLQVPAHESNSGYLYCEDASDTATRLRVATSTTIESDGTSVKSTDEDIFYFNLN